MRPDFICSALTSEDFAPMSQVESDVRKALVAYKFNLVNAIIVASAIVSVAGSNRLKAWRLKMRFVKPRTALVRWSIDRQHTSKSQGSLLRPSPRAFGPRMAFSTSFNRANNLPENRRCSSSGL